MRWKVMKMPITGDKIEYIYQVYKIIDPSEPMHSGNIETIGYSFRTLEEAQQEADKRNKEEQP